MAVFARVHCPVVETFDLLTSDEEDSVPAIVNEWDTIGSGVTFDGTCVDHDCPFYNTIVSCSHPSEGFGTFDIVQNGTAHCVCPICRHPCSRVHNCSFYLCEWMFSGTVLEGDATAGTARCVAKADWCLVDDVESYVTFRQFAVSVWSSLVINVEALDAYD